VKRAWTADPDRSQRRRRDRLPDWALAARTLNEASHIIRAHAADAVDELTGFQMIANSSESQVRATSGKNVSSQNRESVDRIKLVNERPKLQAEMVAGASVTDYMK